MHSVVIEGNQDIAELICEILAEEGFICKTINNYEEAFSYLKTFSPDLVLIDTKIEDYNSLLGLIDESHSISVLTSTSPKDDGNKFAKHFLLKPFSFNELEAIVLNVKNNIDRLNNFKYSERKLNNLKERRM